MNETAPTPLTIRYQTARCTRYCMAHGCPHATAANSPAFFRLKPLYALTIKGLAMGGRGRYRLFNVVFYLLLVPGLLLWLTYGALRNARTIRRLSRARRV